jgi:hypothetical protein
VYRRTARTTPAVITVKRPVYEYDPHAISRLFLRLFRFNPHCTPPTALLRCRRVHALGSVRSRPSCRSSPAAPASPTLSGGGNRRVHVSLSFFCEGESKSFLLQAWKFGRLVPSSPELHTIYAAGCSALRNAVTVLYVATLLGQGSEP